MRIAIYIISIILILLFGFSAHAGGKETIIKLEPLDHLIHLATNGDVDPESKVYIKSNRTDPKKSCYCVCWETEWICTSTYCQKHLKQEESCLYEED